MTTYKPCKFGEHTSNSALVPWMDEIQGICLVEKGMEIGVPGFFYKNGHVKALLDLTDLSININKMGKYHSFGGSLKVTTYYVEYSCSIWWASDSYKTVDGFALTSLDSIVVHSVTLAGTWSLKDCCDHAEGLLPAFTEQLMAHCGQIEAVVEQDLPVYEPIQTFSSPWDVLD